MEQIIEVMSKVFADTWNSTDGRRILSAWCDMEEDIKQELRTAMMASVEAAIKSEKSEICQNFIAHLNRKRRI
jgi:hypothetical protein